MVTPCGSQRAAARGVLEAKSVRRAGGTQLRLTDLAAMRCMVSSTAALETDQRKRCLRLADSFFGGRGLSGTSERVEAQEVAAATGDPSRPPDSGTRFLTHSKSPDVTSVLVLVGFGLSGVSFASCSRFSERAPPKATMRWHHRQRLDAEGACGGTSPSIRRGLDRPVGPSRPQVSEETGWVHAPGRQRGPTSAGGRRRSCRAAHLGTAPGQNLGGGSKGASARENGLGGACGKRAWGACF